MTFDFDYIVIGGGSGGVRSARIAAAHGAKVALVEGQELGGTCVHRGCIPKKLLGYAAHFGHDLAAAREMGWNVDVKNHDWNTLRDNVAAELKRLDGIYTKLMVDNGVTVLNGWAQFTGPHTISVNGKAYSGKYILIATGGHPRALDVPGGDLAMTSDDMFTLPALPDSLAVIGGGYIGLELATILHGLGVKTTLIHKDELPLRGFDPDIRKRAIAQMCKDGVICAMGTKTISLEKHENGIALTTDKGTHIYGGVLAAIGRIPNTGTLALDAAGVATDNGKVLVDECFRTNQKHIYAVGDVSSRFQLTPVAIIEGHYVADHLFGNSRKHAMREEDLPTAVFCEPPVAAIGCTEDQAAARGITLTVYESSFRPLKTRLTGDETQTYMKLLVDSKTDKVVGLHMLGVDTPEILQGFAAAITAGITKTQLDKTLALHPTSAEELVLMRKPRTTAAATA
jgi:glutathione reductase (NADPH)